MRVCFLGAGLPSLTLAKALVNKKIYVDVILSKISKKINLEQLVFLEVILIFIIIISWILTD